ncbi:Inner membrane protein YgaZ [Pelotomaculum schinkii]|uniref:Inner membrane protein YgaZ n=1 Tax=Pelotomaculum schinkii TaxID=78350 RepID=A0A4Y7RF67_9FIRM|nr:MULTISPECIES: AzlC family ABC transporter permease [Pelotomaculum]TEB06967.1 Inner membrane protein YgaZ [Pelotomaculum schinkii]TEB16871.1 Inner membrane protein YgaZ [Pelotomaculum sp. FP]
MALWGAQKEVAQFRLGLMQGLSIFLGYLPAAVAFGVLGASTGLSYFQVAAMSAWVYAGASQFMGLNLLQSGVSVPEIILATFVLNLRHVLMSTVLSKRIQGNRALKGLLSFGITDETFVLTTIGSSVGTGSEETVREITAARFAGVAVIAYSGWVTGTVFGTVFADILPQIAMKSMGISIYAMFIALLVPSMKKSGRVAMISLLGGALNWILLSELKLSTGWSVVAATMLASACGALCYKEGK